LGRPPAGGTLGPNSKGGDDPIMGKYKTRFEYDGLRGGDGVVLLDPRGREVAAVFRDDMNHTVTVEIHRKNIPPAYMPHLFKRARMLLDPFEDGTPLRSARNCPKKLFPDG
jgi:hypothetical protein